jgi:thioredoxin reductase (NADPH)
VAVSAGETTREAELVIVGAGVAGLTAAAVAAEHGVSVLVIERMGAGGQVMNVEDIRNMPGFPEGISGFDLGPMLQERAEAAGVEFLLDEVEGLVQHGSGKHLVRCAGGPVLASAVLIAAGSARRRLDVPGEQALEGRGVSTCASCDGPFFRGRTVCVVGGGDSAFGEAEHLARHASRVVIVYREAEAVAQQSLVEAAARLPNVSIAPSMEVIEITGGQTATGVTVRSADGGLRHIEADGVFVYAGLSAAAAFLQGAVRLDAQGRIETDADHCSSMTGVFAAGDVRAGTPYLLAAVSRDGEEAAGAAVRYLRETTV